MVCGLAVWADGVAWTCWGRGEDCHCHDGRVEDIPRDGWVGRRVAAEDAVVFQPTLARVALGQLEKKPPVGQDPPRSLGSRHWMLANISQQRAHWDGELISRIRAVDARVSHGEGTPPGEGWSSSSHCVKATLSARNSFIVMKPPSWTFVTSLAGMGGRDGDRISGCGRRAPKRCAAGLGAICMPGTGIVVAEGEATGIVWVIDASGGIAPRGVR